jgi:hypothetical protein
MHFLFNFVYENDSKRRFKIPQADFYKSSHISFWSHFIIIMGLDILKRFEMEIDFCF